MGALWTHDQPPSGQASGTRALVRTLRGIDLTRGKKYDAAAPRGATHRGDGSAAGYLEPTGVRLPAVRGGERRVASGFLERLGRILHTDDTPPRAALAFALGVFIAWSPAFGFHVLIALGLAMILRLNRVAILAGTFINNPWTFVPIYSVSAWVGGHLTGNDAAIPRLEGDLSWSQIGDLFAQCRPWIGPLVVGTLVMGILCALLGYVGFLYLIRSYRALRRQE